MPETHPLAHSSNRRERKWSHGILLPSPPIHTYKHTHPCMRAPVPRPPIFSCQARSLVVNMTLSPPTTSFLTHPGQTPTGCSRYLPSEAKKKIPFPFLCRRVAGRPRTQGQTKGWRVSSVGPLLMWAASRCSHTPLGRGEPAHGPAVPAGVPNSPSGRAQASLGGGGLQSLLPQSTA